MRWLLEGIGRASRASKRTRSWRTKTTSIKAGQNCYLLARLEGSVLSSIASVLSTWTPAAFAGKR